MPLTATTRLGPYEVLHLIGSGGMGEVYKARDTRLDRIVAIKVLAEHVATRSELRQRLEREARIISSLNHPHICTLHDVGHQDGVDFLVMEYLEGETLAARLQRGAVPLGQVFRYAMEIADALDQAHRHGVVHRDLKPGNVVLGKSGVKLLDFGLAKVAFAQTTPTTTSLATQTSPMTSEGTILGTLQYMAPEQLEGKEADARSDIFAFGAMLYEMTTGRRAFAGKSQASVIAAIMQTDPSPVSTLEPRAPRDLDRVVRRCLAKDPEERWQSARDLLLDLKTLAEEQPISKAEARSERAPGPLWTVATLIALLAGALGGFWLSRSRVGPAPDVRYLTYSDHDQQPAASPDGRTIAFASDRDGRWRIWLKDTVRGSEVPLTDGPDRSPRFSPDGSMILFSRGEPPHASLYRVAAMGGEPRKLVEDADGGGDWSPDGRYVAFKRAQANQDALCVAGANGEGVREVARMDGLLPFPRWSPDGRTIAAIHDVGGGLPSLIILASADGKSTRPISAAHGGFRTSSLVWSSEDELMYFQQESLSATATAPGSGTSRVVRQNIRSGSTQTIFRSLQNANVLDVVGPGRIVFDAPSNRQNLREYYLKGKRASPEYRWLTQGTSQDRQPVYSPDGEWVLFSSNRSGNLDLWEISTKTGALRRITDDPADDWDPAFTPEGNKILWSSNRGGHLEIWMSEADGSNARQVTNDGADAENPTMTRDGQWIIYVSSNPSKRGIWKIHPDGSMAARLTSSANIPEVSPDGRYAAYLGAGNAMRVVRIADGVDAGFAASNALRPRWIPDGHAIAYTAPNEKGVWGIFVQDFVPGQETSRTRQPMGGFDPAMRTETFGIASDGAHLVISSQESFSNLMTAQQVPGVAPASGSRR